MGNIKIVSHYVIITSESIKHILEDNIHIVGCLRGMALNGCPRTGCPSAFPKPRSEQELTSRRIWIAATDLFPNIEDVGISKSQPSVWRFLYPKFSDCVDIVVWILIAPQTSSSVGFKHPQCVAAGGVHTEQHCPLFPTKKVPYLEHFDGPNSNGVLTIEMLRLCRYLHQESFGCGDYRCVLILPSTVEVSIPKILRL